MLALIASCGAGHAAGVDGLNIHTLDYQGAEDAGRFVYTGKGEVAWTQYGGIGPVHAYSELSREPGRITIEDSIHDRTLILDLARKQVFRLWRDGKQVALYSIGDFEGGDLAAAAASVPACGGLALPPCSDGENPAPCASGLVVNYAMKKCMRRDLEALREVCQRDQG